MKRQDSALSSSSRRRDNNNTPEILHTKTVGCMSGLFHLLSKYHRRRKFLTLGKEHERNVISSQKVLEDNPRKSLDFGKVEENNVISSPLMKDNEIKSKSTGHNRRRYLTFGKKQEKKVIYPQLVQSDDSRLSCDAPRSPTLPAEFRLSTTANSPVKFGALPALVPRLMGLDHRNTVSSTPIPARTRESAAEKRLQLLGALEKCDEDLRALKKIIDAVSTGEQRRSPQRTVVKSTMEAGEEQPSPVSVLVEFGSSPLYGGEGYTKRHTNGRVLLQQQQKKIQDGTTALNLIDRMVTEAKSSENYSTLSLTSNKAMKQSVEEVCRELNWGEKREMGRISLALQNYICTDLIEEIVVEFSCSFISSLPFDACRRQLCF